MLKRLRGPLVIALLAIAAIVAGSYVSGNDYVSCVAQLARGMRPVASDRGDRFLGKPNEVALRCRGDERALANRETPWVDWSNYWSTGDKSSRAPEWLGDVPPLRRFLKDGHGETGALIDLEYQRLELIKFNLFDNATYKTYVTGEGGVAGPALRRWPQMRLTPDDPAYVHLQIDADGNQRCAGPLIRHRTANGVCNDIDNPAMGAARQLFARNVEFHETDPSTAKAEFARHRHAGRIALLTPDPQVISRRLFTRHGGSATCNNGQGLPGNSAKADCPYRKAPFFNALAAFWIQFMTHDWFSHLEEARNSDMPMQTGCQSAKVDGIEQPMLPEGARALGCRPDDLIERALVAQSNAPGTFRAGGHTRLERAYQTSRNFNTAWWDASQIYGYDRRSSTRLQRDGAKIRMVKLKDRSSPGDQQGYLPVLQGCQGRETDCLLRPEWAGQETAGFPDNWTVGLSFLHTVFAREHNLFVDAFKREARHNPRSTAV
ncbi:MAG: peroxidase family protein [Hyphomicrobiaceae bacterium]